jgi:hypothetical protein
MVTVPFSRETVTLVKSPSINPCDCLNAPHAGTGVVDDNADRYMISIGDEEECYDFVYDCEYESDLQEISSGDVDGDAHESTCTGTGTGTGTGTDHGNLHTLTPANSATVTAPTDSRFLMRDLIYHHHECDASARQRYFASHSHQPTRNKIETLNLVTFNAKATAAAAASSRQTLASGTSKFTGTPSSYVDSDVLMYHQQQYQPQPSVDITNYITETLCTEPAHAPTERSCLVDPPVFRRREPSTTPHPRSRCTTPVYRRRSPLVEVTIDADICGDRKETVIAGWVYCEEELTINTDLSCEDSECDHECHCFGMPHISKLHDQDCEHYIPSAVMNQFMYTKRSSPPLDDFDVKFYNEKANSCTALIDLAAGKYDHHVIHQYDDDNDDDECDRCYTETESETSYEGDDEVSITEPLRAGY